MSTRTKPQAGCFFIEAFLGDADVTVEIEHEPESGDGWNEPRYDASYEPINVLINGTWVDASEFSDRQCAAWRERAVEHLQDLQDSFDEDRAEARAEARREMYA